VYSTFALSYDIFKYFLRNKSILDILIEVLRIFVKIVVYFNKIMLKISEKYVDYMNCEMK